MTNDLMAIGEDLTAAEARKLAGVLEKLADKKRDAERKAGQPTDSFVQMLARERLRELRADHSIREIGEMYGVSHARVAQLERALGLKD